MSKRWGILLLGIWMILFGILQLGVINISGVDTNTIVAGIGIAAGALMILNR